MRDCFDLRSLPEELALFPWKEIRLDNSGYLMKNKAQLPKSLRDNVLIKWDYGGEFYFYNINITKNPNFEKIIELLASIYDTLDNPALIVLIKTFPSKKLKILRILEQWVEKISNPDTIKVFRIFVFLLKHQKK